MRVVLVGAGAVGARAARQLCTTDAVEHLAIVDADAARAQQVASSMGTPAVAAVWAPSLLVDADVLVLASPGDAGTQRAQAEAALERRVHVVSVTDSLATVRALLELDAEARERAVTVAVGAGFSPGLSCVLARHAGSGLTTVEEVHVARVGSGGPSCAAERRRALNRAGLDWRDGSWTAAPPGSGRQQVWFPDPIGAVDCARAALPDALLVAPAFPGVRRVTARTSSTMWERAAARLPVRRSKGEDAVGAVWVEVRGTCGAASDVRVLGALDRPALAAGAVAALTTGWLAEGRVSRAGAAGLAELITDTVPFLHDLARRGVRAATFEAAGTSE